jgi:hypothetical protein
MGTSTVLACALVLGAALPCATARADGPGVLVVFRGRADPALAALVASELAASGHTPEVVLDPRSTLTTTSDAAIALEIYLGATEAYAVVHVGPGFSNAAPLPIDDLEAAALGAVSLVLEAPRSPPHAAPSCSDLGTALGTPRLGDPVAAAAPRSLPHRGVVVDVAASTAVFLNGGSLGLGAFLGRDVLVELHGRALVVWTTGLVLPLLSASVAYVARFVDVDFEVGGEVGAITFPGVPGQFSLGAQLGGFAGLAIDVDPSAAVLVRLGLYAAQFGEVWMPAGLLSLGMRIAP